MSKVLFKTSLGDIELTLNAEKAPKTVENFLSYVKSGHYNDTIFHRVIPGFMVQGGGFDEKMEQKPTQAQIKNEANNGLKNKIGSVAMARTNDPHSASAQFFINVKDNDFLNFSSESGNGWGYAVFGEVTSGMPTVEKIVAVKTGNNGFHQDVPVTPVKVISAEVVE